ncbi:MAG: hypothetical protein A2W31_00330 [Planctomycetes bacterium RBG_16_64_10]|nr:MAG: hypothetical protein A2W31_00330 [Planctomycetes bacterium RBG_16_64_10]
MQILDGQVRILKANGRISTVPLVRLRQADLQFVRGEAVAAVRRGMLAQVANGQGGRVPATGTGF